MKCMAEFTAYSFNMRDIAILLLLMVSSAFLNQHYYCWNKNLSRVLTDLSGHGHCAPNDQFQEDGRTSCAACWATWYWQGMDVFLQNFLGVKFQCRSFMMVHSHANLMGSRCSFQFVEDSGWCSSWCMISHMAMISLYMHVADCCCTSTGT
jgi:hypothetical protein